MSLHDLLPLRIGPYEFEIPVILAPMAAVSEAPFRALALSMGAGLAPTELVSAKGLKYQNARTESYLKHDPLVENPFTVQIFGGEPEAMAEGAEHVVRRGAKIIDINMGCPVKKVTKTGAGSALMCDPKRTEAIIREMRSAVGDEIPITAKIRAGWDSASVNAPEFGRVLEGAGVAAIAIHGRTRKQGYAGFADRGVIKRLVEAVEVPVIANGDITTPQEADQVIRETGCAAVMVGRGALGNPWCFQQFRAACEGREAPPAPARAARADLIQEHFDAHVEHLERHPRAVKKFRQHLIWYSRGYRGGAVFRGRAMQLEGTEEVRDAIDGFFRTSDPSDTSEAAVYDARRALG